MGFKDTVDRTNRMDMESDDDDTRNGYIRTNMCVWRLMTKSFLDTTEEAKSMRLQIRDEFGNTLDGFDLIQYLKQYSNEMSTTDVRHIKSAIDGVKFDKSESPQKWMLKMQQMRELWLRLPSISITWISWRTAVGMAR